MILQIIKEILYITSAKPKSKSSTFPTLLSSQSQMPASSLHEKIWSSICLDDIERSVRLLSTLFVIFINVPGTLDKLGFRHLFNCHQVEVVQPSIAFDVASLMLYGTQAIPVRLKILLDRLFSVLQHEEVLQVLHGFGWTHEDYARGYIVQDPSGAVLDRWLLASREEEPLILQQFLRFGETKTIAQQLLLQESTERADFVIQPPRTESDIKKFIERTNRNVVGSSLFKQHSSHIYSHMGCSVQSLPLLGSKSSFRHLSSSVNSTQSISPTVSSPINCTSPVALSPLNKLQNMQPYDFRHEKSSPDLPKSENLDRQPSATGAVYGVNSITSPTTSVPHISFSTSSLTNISSTNNSSTYTTASSERSGNEDGIYCSEGEDEDATNTAINLTRSSLTTSYMDSVYAAKKVRHLRKSANPMKRRWNPTVLATLSTNPATGKKRVQCHVCLKTFCDKGALKIHFSAVHLREMHKCTVEGCNMMFSSRRSRNRHSANPNPKLHTPNYRRKINPHDGRAANPYPLMPPSGILDFANGIMSTYSSGPHDGESSSESELDRRPITPRRNSLPEIKTEIPSAEISERLPIEDDAPLPLTKKFRIEENLRNCGEEGMDLSMKEERRNFDNDNCVNEERRQSDKDMNNKNDHRNSSSDVKDLRVTVSETSTPFQSLRSSADKIKNEAEDGTKNSLDSSKPNSGKSEYLDVKSQMGDRDKILSTKGVRKRKSLNPIKCPTTSDDDLPFASSDDSSSDTYIDQDNDENGLLDSKSDYLSSDGSDSINDLDDMDDNNSENEKEKSNNGKISNQSVTPPTSSAVVATSQILTPNNNLEKNYSSHERYNGFSMSDLDKFRHEISTNQMKESDDLCENPLRHLESLSLGAFTNMMNVNNRTSFNHRGTSVSSGVSYHAPGLGLASVTTTTAPNRVESPGMEVMPPLISSSHPPPLTSNCHLNNSDTENSMSDQQMGMVPVFRDASMVGSVEIPVDKENPRRCTACGKIFQNHFGVKTHYQNVHLKLMHKCTVEGCNASFPSKRSRDRHSANLNLHRKLLSTSSDRSAGGYFDKTGTMYPFHPDAYRGDLFTRLYDHNSLPLSFAEIYHNRLSAEGAASPFLSGSPFSHLPGTMPAFHPAFLPPATTVTNYKNENTRYHHEQNSGRNSSISSISNPSSPGPSLRGSPRETSGHLPAVKLEEDLLPDSDGRFVCTICEKKFHEGVVLREHYEKSHTQVLLHCSMSGCNKVFLSRQTRNNHSDNLHKEKNLDAT
ncbi:zinc finger protein basonuclin-2 [Trichonephila inaurata madagascariensis]|uniref:Zinc finger protein basonuclin-2 n=1 Tax=Trichonephila inaurata madagascariensis TaxID=2747483 RepID=A0A8X6WU81_9ARAC|nr:zinc finger protein basonuclin-2 [Trichonephila inaurata madagascariensis]